MIESSVLWTLLIGYPEARPGGLLLSLLYFWGSAITALILAFLFNFLSYQIQIRYTLQIIVAVIRGVPPLLLLLFISVSLSFTPEANGFIGLSLYSFSYVFTIIFATADSYPYSYREQACIMGLAPLEEYILLRVPWLLMKSKRALITHWVSLIKDTGVLMILGIGELTTITRDLTEKTFSMPTYTLLIFLSSSLYLVVSIILIKGLEVFGDAKLSQHGYKRMV